MVNKLKSVPCADLVSQLVRKGGYQLCGAKVIIILAQYRRPRLFLTEVRLFFPSRGTVTDSCVGIVFDDVVPETQLISFSTQDLIPLFERLSSLEPIWFRND